MREILFRGKIIELCEYQGQWLEGFYAVENGKPFIAIPKENGLNGFYCGPETVGQYTGLTDLHSNHNKGKKPTQKAVDKLIERNHIRKGTRQPYKRNDVTTQKVAELVQKGYSVNRISIELKCDWSTIKARIHDNPELMEVEEHD